MFFVLVLASRSTSFGALSQSKALPKIFLVDNSRACDYWFSMSRLDCKDLKTQKTTTYSLQDYKNRFGVPFQLTQKTRRVEVGGLIWQQSGFKWTISRGINARLSLTDSEFHGLYSQNQYFRQKGVVKGSALCRAGQRGRKFSCLLPWGQNRIFSRRGFLRFFVKKRLIKPYSPVNKCFGSRVRRFWNVDGRVWKCWNYNFWPDLDVTNQGSEGMQGSRRRRYGYYGGYLRRQRPWNYYHFVKKFGDLGYILEDQPKKVVNACQYSQKMSNVAELSTWKCELQKMKKFDFELKQPRYLPKKKNYLIMPNFMNQRLKKLLPVIRGTKSVDVFYAVLTATGKTRYLVDEDYQNLFVKRQPVGAIFTRNSPQRLYTMQGDKIIKNPILDASGPHNSGFSVLADKGYNPKRLPEIFIKVTSMNKIYKFPDYPELRKRPKGVTAAQWGNPMFKVGYYLRFKDILKKRNNANFGMVRSQKKNKNDGIRGRRSPVIKKWNKKTKIKGYTPKSKKQRKFKVVKFKRKKRRRPKKVGINGGKPVNRPCRMIAYGPAPPYIPRKPKKKKSNPKPVSSAQKRKRKPKKVSSRPYRPPTSRRIRHMGYKRRKQKTKKRTQKTKKSKKKQKKKKIVKKVVGSGYDFEKELRNDPYSLYFVFRGLKIKNKDGLFFVLDNKKFSGQEFSINKFLDKFAARRLEEIGKRYGQFVPYTPIPILS